jgi:hypothetical protein
VLKASFRKEERAKEGAKIQRRQARLLASAKRSFDLEVDRRLFPPIALDLVLDGLSLV